MTASRPGVVDVRTAPSPSAPYVDHVTAALEVLVQAQRGKPVVDYGRPPHPVRGESPTR